MALYKTNKRDPEDPPKKRSPYLMYNTPTATSDATSMRGTQKQALYIPISEQIAKEKARQELNKRATQNRSYIVPGKEKTDIEKQQSAEKLAVLTDETNPANPNYLGAYNTRFAINPYAKGSTAALQEKQFNQNVQAAFMGAGAGKLVGVAGKAIPYLNTPLTIGSKTFPAITPANIAEVGFGVEGAKNLYPSTREFIENPSITSGLDVGMNAILAVPLAGKVVREAKPFMQEGVNVAKNTGSQIYKINPYRFKPKDEALASSSFKSEINWGKWNKEIPNNKSLMDEYLQIEKTAKQNGTWMKNPDGSAFKGTPEQFVQQNSSNFKKAFPNPILDKNNNIQINYHGSPNKFSEFKVNDRIGEIGSGIYTTSDRNYAKAFSKSMDSWQSKPSNDATVLELYQNSNNPQNYYKDYEKYVDSKVMDFDNKYRFMPKFTKKYKIAEKKLNNDLSSVHSKLYNEGKINKIQDGFDSFTKQHQTVVPFDNYPKSAIGNNGMFDMTNPNIYKSALLPVGTMVGGASLYNINK